MQSRTFTVSASAGGNSVSQVFIPDRHVTPFNIGFGAVVATTAHYTIQHTFQDPLQVTAANITWFAHDFITGASALSDGNYAFPVAGIRVQVSAASEGGVSVTFVQAGIVS